MKQKYDPKHKNILREAFLSTYNQVRAHEQELYDNGWTRTHFLHEVCNRMVWQASGEALKALTGPMLSYPPELLREEIEAIYDIENRNLTIATILIDDPLLSEIENKLSDAGVEFFRETPANGELPVLKVPNARWARATGVVEAVTFGL